MSALAGVKPVPLPHLAVTAGVAPGFVQTFLERHPHALLTNDGWIDALMLFDGVWFTHELSEVERDVGLLSADDALTVLAVLAAEGLPLAADEPRATGEVVGKALPDLPPRLAGDLPAGQGLIGQALVGPVGWLDPYRAGELLRLRLRDGHIEMGVTRPSAEPSRWVDEVHVAGVVAAEDALDRYPESADHEAPTADLAQLIAELLLASPELGAAPLPPLRPVLREVGCEVFGGRVGVRGVTWDLARVRSLGRAETVAAIRVLRALLTWDGHDAPAVPELLGRLTTAEEVVRYVADEVERRTVVEGVSLTGPLDRLRAAARGSAERAAVTLLRARAAEGAADSVTAERLVHQALADQPRLVPALMDAGEYAACRGDLRAADGYLRRVDHSVAGSLLKAVRSVLDEPAMTGRNQPCPCGSGRKYKVCCLASEARPLTVRAPLLYALLGMYAQRAPSADLLSLLITRSAGNPHSVFLCVDLVVRHHGFTDRFLRARGGWLRGDERDLVAQWEKIPIGLYEIREVRRGVGVTMRSLPGGTPFFQRDRLFSTSVRRLDLLCGRLLTDGSRLRVLAAPAYLPRDLRQQALELFATDPSAEQIAMFFGSDPDPYVLNSDRHELCYSELTLEVPDVGPAWQRLAQELVQIDHDTLAEHAEIDGKTVSRGSVTRAGRRWTLSANSRERLAALAERVRAAAPDAREVSRQHERMGGGPPADGTPGRTLILDSYPVPGEADLDEQQMQSEVLRGFSESWLDTPVCHGLTPRQAAKAGGDARVELEAILDDMQWRAERLREEGKPPPMDVDRLRREVVLGAQAHTVDEDG
jgi:hypothetical protein